METKQNQAKTYLESVILGITPRGVEIICKEDTIGINMVIIPNVATDYNILIGYKGNTTNLLRDLMKLWKKEHAPKLSINLLVPKPDLIEEIIEQ